MTMNLTWAGGSLWYHCSCKHEYKRAPVKYVIQLLSSGEGSSKEAQRDPKTRNCKRAIFFVVELLGSRGQATL